MNQVNKNGKFRMLLIGSIIGIILTVSILAGLYFLIGPADSSEVYQPTDSAEETVGTEATETATEATEATDGYQADLVVDTPFCALYYPGEWSSSVRTEILDLGYGFAVHFYGTSHNREAELFSILFAFETENSTFIGSIEQNGILTDVHVEIAEFAADDSWDSEAANEILAMQEDVQYLLDRLAADPFFKTQGTADDDIVPDLEDAAVETPYGTLYYPGMWKNEVIWEVASAEDGCTVTFFESFSALKAPVFMLTFNNPEDTGFHVGTIRHEGSDIEVYLTLHNFPQTENWSDSDRSLFTTLQEQSFQLLSKLSENPQYTSMLG